MKNFIKNLLLIFVFISIGYALGKHTANDENAEQQATHSVTESNRVEGESYTQVLYFHGNQRCKTCKMIESMAKRSVNNSFKSELGKSVRWKVLNYQSEKELAKKFELSFSTVVVTKVENGEIIDFQRLDGVWEKLNTEMQFSDYITTAVNSYLGDEK